MLKNNQLIKDRFILEIDGKTKWSLIASIFDSSLL